MLYWSFPVCCVVVLIIITVCGNTESFFCITSQSWTLYILPVKCGVCRGRFCDIRKKLLFELSKTVIKVKTGGTRTPRTPTLSLTCWRSYACRTIVGGDGIVSSARAGVTSWSVGALLWADSRSYRTLVDIWVTRNITTSCYHHRRRRHLLPH